MVKTRKIIKEEPSIEGGLPNGKCYCRKCQKIKSDKDFYKAIDETIDSNGFFSLCKGCIGETYKKILEIEHGSINLAVLFLCKKLNVLYSEDAISSTIKHFETTNWSEDKFYGVYLAKLRANSGLAGFSFPDLTYKDNVVVNNTNKDVNIEEDSQTYEELESFWGTNKKEDLEFLERNFSEFKRSHKVDTYSEVVLTKEVCFKMLEIHKDRLLHDGKANDNSTKQLMEIMKNLAISPNMVSVANSGKQLDTFGNWIKDIETMRPAEWVEDKSIYADVDNIEEYGEKYLTSPMRALVIGNREFSLDSQEEDFSDEE